jgi:hypothetical protein
LLAREENLGGQVVLVAKFLLALEEGGPSVLACPGGEWSERPCLPWRRIVVWATQPPQASRGPALAREARQGWYVVHSI